MTRRKNSKTKPKAHPGSEFCALPWESAAFAVIQQVQLGVPFGTAELSAIIKEHCEAYADQQTATLRGALERLRDGGFVGTPINEGSGAMLLIEETLSKIEALRKAAE